MAQADQLSSPVMGCAAGFDPYQAGSQLLEELQQPRSRQLLSNDDAALSIDAVHLEHRLRDVQTNRGYMSHGSPPALPEA